MSTLELGFDDALRDNVPELLHDLSAHCAAVIQDYFGVEARRAEQAAWEIAERMTYVWGGQSVYIPKGVSFKVSRRDRKIFGEFDGSNHSDLARRYGVSLQWIYKIVKAVRAEEIARRQGSLLQDEANGKTQQNQTGAVPATARVR